ncbi:MAG: class I SAM-dependent methyltransferase [Betaproteobacteria bacterium]
MQNKRIPVQVSIDSGPDQIRSIAEYRDLAPGYDASCRLIDHIRRAAVDALELRAGETVLDIACGTGATLPELAARVGPRGKVIGIDHSPEMTIVARQRIATAGARNIEIILGPAESVHIAGRADAVLFCFAHDILQSATALDNIFSMARNGARVASVGAKLSGHWWSAPLDHWVRWRGQRYRTTNRGLACPWAPLQDYCADLRITDTFHLGTSYLAYGTHSKDAKFSSHRRNSSLKP